MKITWTPEASWSYAWQFLSGLEMLYDLSGNPKQTGQCVSFPYGGGGMFLYIWNSIKYSNFLEDDRLQKIVILCEFEEIFVIGSGHVKSL